MSIYKKITSDNVSTHKTEIFKTHSINDIFWINPVTGLTVTTAEPIDEKITSALWMNTGVSYSDITDDLIKSYQSQYNSLKTSFYLSGSDYSVSESRFNTPHFKRELGHNLGNPQHFNKFHSGSFYNTGSSTGDQRGLSLSIPQHYVGDYIKPGSFSLELGAYVGNDGLKTKIVDDKYGNLYSTNAFISKSSATALSSSDNYIGNIFYKSGVVTITAGNEKMTGSTTFYSGVLAGALNATNITCSFQSAKEVYITEYALTIEPNEFNKTNNPTAKTAQTGSAANYLAPHLTASNWTPYFNHIGFFDENDVLVARASYPQYIKTRDDIPIILKIKMDW